MVLKLIKHEWKYLGRYLLLVWLATLLMIISQRFLSELVNSHNDVASLIGSAAVMLMVFSVMAMFLVTFFAVLIRFYKSMFSGEGYLTFTLPVKTWQIIFSKLLVGILVMMVPVIVLIALIVSYIPNMEMLPVVFARIFEFLQEMEIPMYAVVLYTLAMMLAPAVQILEFYTAMSLGQLANRNKVIFSIIAYIAIYSVKQVIGTAI